MDAVLATKARRNFKELVVFAIAPFLWSLAVNWLRSTQLLNEGLFQDFLTIFEIIGFALKILFTAFGIYCQLVFVLCFGFFVANVSAKKYCNSTFWFVDFGKKN